MEATERARLDKWGTSLRTFYGVHSTVMVDKKGLSREDWLQVRKSGIGGSDIGAILGHSKYRCAIDVWCEKTGRDHLLEEVSEEQQAAMDSGNDMEELILDLYAKKTGRKVIRVNAVLSHPDHPNFLVNLDAICQREDGTWGVLEVKNTMGWGAEWKDGNVPQTYVDQCRWGMFVTSLEWGEVVSLRSGRWTEESRHPVELDTEYPNLALDAAIRFWRDCVVADQRPSLRDVSGGDSYALWKSAIDRITTSTQRKTVNADYRMTRIAERLVEVKSLLKNYEMEEESLKALIADEIGGEGSLVTRFGEITLTRGKPTSSFDRKRFAKEHPEMEKSYCVEKEASLTLRMPK